ncbi:MAG: universal stress protein [Haloarculaceae archaeon]
MVHFLAATDSVETSERLCEYLSGRVDTDDTVSALNSLRGGDDTDDGDIRAGEEAVDYVAEALDCAVETRQFVRGNAPATDVFEFAEENDVDEIVIGIHKRNPTGKVIFGSTAQDILLESDWPIVAVPAHW